MGRPGSTSTFPPSPHPALEPNFKLQNQPESTPAAQNFPFQQFVLSIATVQLQVRGLCYSWPWMLRSPRRQLPFPGYCSTPFHSRGHPSDWRRCRCRFLHHRSQSADSDGVLVTAGQKVLPLKSLQPSSSARGRTPSRSCWHGRSSSSTTLSDYDLYAKVREPRPFSSERSRVQEH